MFRIRDRVFRNAIECLELTFEFFRFDGWVFRICDRMFRIAIECLEFAVNSYECSIAIEGLEFTIRGLEFKRSLKGTINSRTRM